MGADGTERLSVLRSRLAGPMPRDGIWGWIWPLVITAIGGFLRFNRLAVPRAIMFDETYYAKDAWSILQNGVEWCWVNKTEPPGSPSYADRLVNAGNTHFFAACSYGGHGEYVVQPELGKELIAIGEAIFGLNSFGWRFMSAVFGTLAILLICRIARRMTRSTLLGCIAGLLMSLDGLEFVMSRIGILDIFLMFFVLAAFGAMVIDRDVSRERLAELVAAGQADGQPNDQSNPSGPRLGIRKWRVAAGICVGLAIGVKWNGIYYLFGLAILGTCWDTGARRAAGLRSYIRGTFSRDVIWLPVTYLLIPVVVYVVTWSDWLFSSTGYDRQYAAQHGIHIPGFDALYSLFEYHKEAIQFGLGLSTRHPYQSQPWDWLLMTRPVAFWYTCYTGPLPGPTHVCPATGYTGPQYSQEVLALGTPAIWWGSILALIACTGWWLLYRDWRAGAALCGVIVGWLPWFPLVSRTKFFYYALEFEPFLILAITLCLGLIIGQASASLGRRAIGAGIAGAYLIIVLLMFRYFYPILAGKVIPYSDWYAHMWYTIGKGWI
ncbi:MAG TPA: phospholipid carrier-dependent glycosyltransferase [Streptosporangiaceae bacterium]